MILPLKYHYLWEDSGHDIEKFVEAVEVAHQDELDDLRNECEQLREDNDYRDESEDYEEGYEAGMEEAIEKMRRILADLRY